MTMALRRLVFSLAYALACAALPALAQPSGPAIQVPGANAPRPGPRPLGPVPGTAPASTQRPSNQTVPLDRVIAVVNDEALTQYELDEQKRVVLQQMRANNVRPPPPDVWTRRREAVEEAIRQASAEAVRALELPGLRLERAAGRTYPLAAAAAREGSA